MKKILAVLGLFALFAVVFAGSPSEYEAPRQAPYFFKSITYAVDTTTTSGTAATVYEDWGTYNSKCEYRIQWEADSLSGATAATVYLEWSATLDTASYEEEWNVISTGTIDGVTSEGYFTGDVPGGQLRTRAVFAGTAQSTTLNQAGVFTSAYAQ